MKNLNLDIDLLPGRVPHLVIRGALDMASVGWFDEVVGRMLDWESDRIVIDFSEVSFISSGAIGILIAAAEEYGQRGGRIFAVNPSDRILHVFTLCALVECMTFVAGVNEALGVCA